MIFFSAVERQVESWRALKSVVSIKEDPHFEGAKDWNRSSTRAITVCQNQSSLTSCPSPCSFSIALFIHHHRCRRRFFSRTTWLALYETRYLLMGATWDVQSTTSKRVMKRSKQCQHFPPAHCRHNIKKLIYFREEPSSSSSPFTFFKRSFFILSAAAHSENPLLNLFSIYEKSMWRIFPFIRLNDAHSLRWICRLSPIEATHSTHVKILIKIELKEKLRPEFLS